MEFTNIQWKKTVEGNYDVQLIHNNVVVATINFPTEALASEYVDIKQKLKAHADALIAEVTANLTKVETKAETAIKNLAAKVTEQVQAVAKEAEDETETAETKIETFAANVKNKIEKQAVIDTSAKAAKSPDGDWQASAKAKVGKDVVIDTSAKIVVP
jgi:F0F1-type ATP synthase membrane subunit b/b'